MAPQTHVLLVEDNDVDASAISRSIQKNATDFQLERVKRMADCLTALRDGVNVVLLDLGLPDCGGGLDALRTVRDAHRELPIVVVTGQADEQIAVDALREGAQDYIVKEQLGQSNLTRVIRYAITRMDRARAERMLREAEFQMAAAREVQQALFPKELPNIKGYDLAARCLSAYETSGDYYDIFPMGEDLTGLCVGDAAGKGLGPAMVMTASRAVLRTLGRLMDDLSQTMQTANQYLTEDVPQNRFVTLMMARLNSIDHTVEYIGAGHDAHVVRANGDAVTLDPHGPPLIISDATQYQAASQVEMNPGDVLLMVTDGIWETKSPDQEIYGTERMLQVVRDNQDRTAEEILSALYDDVAIYRVEPRQHDDMTAIVLKRNVE